MNLLVTVVLIANLQVTSYRSIPEQTDNSPFTTSIGERVHPHGLAVSQDLLKKNGGPLDYGDTVYIESIGFKVINDTMNPRHHVRADVWVAAYQHEKEFDKKYGKRKLKLWLVKPIIK